MAHRGDEAPPAPDAGPTALDADAALAEIQRVTSRVRAKFWPEVIRWGALALFLPASVFVRHAYPKHEGWIVIAIFASLALTSVLEWHSGVVAWGASRRLTVLGYCTFVLYIAANSVVWRLPPGLSTWAVVIAVVPGLPALAGVAWVLRR